MNTKLQLLKDQIRMYSARRSGTASMPEKRKPVHVENTTEAKRAKIQTYEKARYSNNSGTTYEEVGPEEHFVTYDKSLQVTTVYDRKKDPQPNVSKSFSVRVIPEIMKEVVDEKQAKRNRISLMMSAYEKKRKSLETVQVDDEVEQKSEPEWKRTVSEPIYLTDHSPKKSNLKSLLASYERKRKGLEVMDCEIQILDVQEKIEHVYARREYILEWDGSQQVTTEEEFCIENYEIAPEASILKKDDPKARLQQKILEYEEKRKLGEEAFLVSNVENNEQVIEPENENECYFIEYSEEDQDLIEAALTQPPLETSKEDRLRYQISAYEERRRSGNTEEVEHNNTTQLTEYEQEIESSPSPIQVDSKEEARRRIQEYMSNLSRRQTQGQEETEKPEVKVQIKALTTPPKPIDPKEESRRRIQAYMSKFPNKNEPVNNMESSSPVCYMSPQTVSPVVLDPKEESRRRIQTYMKKFKKPEPVTLPVEEEEEVPEEEYVLELKSREGDAGHVYQILSNAENFRDEKVQPLLITVLRK